MKKINPKYELVCDKAVLREIFIPDPSRNYEEDMIEFLNDEDEDYNVDDYGHMYIRTSRINARQPNFAHYDPECEIIAKMTDNTYRVFSREELKEKIKIIQRSER